MEPQASALIIELVFFEGCPHVDLAREALRTALDATGLAPRRVEWDQLNAATPDRLQLYGSPTTLIGGVDVTGAASTHGRTCRADSIPTVDTIAKALLAWRHT